MQKESQDKYTGDLRESTNFGQSFLVESVDETSKYLERLAAQDQLHWAYEKFDEKFVLTTSFGMASASTVLDKLYNDYMLKFGESN